MKPLPDCMTLWIGDRLGPVERACLRSVVGQGHRLALYCYARPAGVPEGVEVRDAAEILPQSTVFRHRSGSFALFADWFRYELLLRGLGTWVDTDVYLLAPLEGEREHLFGEQQAGLINNAVLRLPPRSPILPQLLKPFRNGAAPAGLPLRSRLKRLVPGRAELADLPWGSTGPHALTALTRRFSIASEALPPDILYPVPWQRAEWIRDPSLQLSDMVTGRTVAVHLWNERIRGFKNQPAPEGSFLHRLQSEGEG